MSELTKAQESAIYDAAKHVGIPSEKATALLDILKMCGLELRSLASVSATVPTFDLKALADDLDYALACVEEHRIYITELKRAARTVRIAADSLAAAPAASPQQEPAAVNATNYDAMAALLKEWLSTELDAQDEEFPEFIDSFTTRAKQALAIHAAPQRNTQRTVSDRDAMALICEATGCTSNKAMALWDRLKGARTEERRSGWIKVEDRMPREGQYVLAFYLNALGKGRTVRAEYAGKTTLELGDDQEAWPGCFVDEAAEKVYCEPGWYEHNENDETNWRINEEVTHWQPLPSPPMNVLRTAEHKP